MGLITKEVEMTWTNISRKIYEPKGYTFTKLRDSFIVDIKDLEKCSNKRIFVKCDGEDCVNKEPYEIVFQKLNKQKHNSDDKHYCRLCAIKLYGHKNQVKSRLENGKSFYDACIENEKYEILNRWDYELNKISPIEVSYNSTGFNGKGYYFKCENNKHDSELRRITKVFNGNKLLCSKCNSFAQWGIDTFGEDFLYEYWDYEKNELNPWEIPKASHKKIWIKCTEFDYHGSYEISAGNFYMNKRCPFCCCANGVVHPLDSLGEYLKNNVADDVWSDKNSISPFNLSKYSREIVWWKCKNKKHNDYQRIVNSSNTLNFRCPLCNISYGEELVMNFLNKNNIRFTPQKEFDSLIGLGFGNLSYDFYIEDKRTLIEFQGIQHEKFTIGLHKNYSDFEKQLEHDKRKREYAINNGYNLIEIWHNQCDMIEDLLMSIL